MGEFPVTRLIPFILAGATVAALDPHLLHSENVDPLQNGSQYVYAENVGWLNAEPLGDGGPGVQVEDFRLTGWMWGENIGWASLSCQNTGSCGAVTYGVTNDGHGMLAGFAWSEAAGWISFSCASTGSCTTASYGVTVDPFTGRFDGRAWSENLGWITFASLGPVSYGLATSWCQATASPPAGSPDLTASTAPGGDVLLSWTAPAGAAWYEVVRGSLGLLQSSGGDFTAATQGCVASGLTGSSILFAEPSPPPPGAGHWFLVRGANCKGDGTWDSGSPWQLGLRDAEIAGSAGACP
ncbi:MAG: hypothetical protein ACREAA_16010 [Candidatus Polarisedimenticolia bacterium]